MNTAAITLALGLAISPSAAGAPSHDVLTAPLSGAQETTPADADGVGIGVVRVDTADGQLCYLLVAVKLDGDVLAAHIHQAPAGSAGPVVVGLSPPVNRFVKACTTVAPALAQDLAANPQDYYINIHTSVYPAGAVRGQLR